MGMRPKDFWDMEPRVFYNAYRGWQKQHEDLQKAEWERARFVAVVAGNAGMYKKGLKESQFRFPWEKATTGWKTKEEIKAFEEECKRLHD